MASKRVSLASLAADPVESVPGASRPDLIHIAPDSVAPTPLNPRRAFDATELAELGEDMRSGQLQPCVAVAKTAYLKLYPEHADKLPDSCRYVMAAGERRWRAAIKAGLPTLDVMVRHDLTETRVRFLAAVLSENVQRANFNPVEEADGLRAMLELHDGNQAAAARAMGKSKAWFNQRIGLLRLSDQMVQLVFAGKLTAFRDMRRYAALPAEDQYPAWQQDQETPRPVLAPLPTPPAPRPQAAVTPVAEASERQSTAEGQGSAYTAVYAGPAEPAAQDAAEGETAGKSFTAVKLQPPQPDVVAPRQPEPAEPDPAAAVAPADPAEPRTLPYGDGLFVAQHLIRKMPPGALELAIRLLNEHAAQEGLNVTPEHAT